MAVRKSKFDKQSRIFEQENLKRLKKCAVSVSHAKDVIADAKRQIELSKELLERAHELKQGSR